MIGKALKALQESGGKHVDPNPNPTQAKIIMAGRFWVRVSLLACFSLVLHAGQHVQY